MITVQKRNGDVVPFLYEKIEQAVVKAAQAVANTTAAQLDVSAIVDAVTDAIRNLTFPVSVETIQDAVERALLAQGHRDVARAYMAYRDEKAAMRRRRPGKDSARKGLMIRRVFTTPDNHPYDLLTWELRTAAITGEDGKVVFEQKGVEFPSTWSQLATNVVVQKYFRGAIGSPTRERSLRQLVDRVANTITQWGIKDCYFRSQDDAMTFRDELAHLLVNQKMAFNSPVWFNVGVELKPQCSACFINSVEDTMESILTLAKTEGMLFKFGSGTGTNMSPLRGSKEPLRGGGSASGPVSFMRGFDAFAGVIKSGGKTRRAAKMVILNCDHPDVRDFIQCKAREEKKAHALIDAGYDGSFNGEAYNSVFFQNSNNSVRVTDEFMQAVVSDGDHALKGHDGSVVEVVKAKAIWREIAEAAWQCGDPGVQFDTTCNEWHTSPTCGRINASNPCSEYMYVDDSACNLASLNLRKFQLDNGDLDIGAFEHAVDLTILAQEIIVGNSSYPTERIAENSHNLRPLGLGYANLGALLMSRGLPYDSDEGRAYAGAVTAIMGGRAYRMSAQIARDHGGPFAGYAKNREPFLAVMRRHRLHVDRSCHESLRVYARQAWDEAIEIGSVYGFRNGQATVLAPTGTIGFMMDCDTTGIEPDIALVKYKRLVGGGMLKITNQTVAEALTRLGYDAAEAAAIIKHIESEDTIEGAPGLRREHLEVFDCAFRPIRGERSIVPAGHVRMMAACQPFLSGAISKTVNMPSDATVDDIEAIYMQAWKLGLKAVAIYRDGCKRSQPLSTSSTAAATVVSSPPPTPTPTPYRRKLPDERHSITHKFSIGGHEGYVHVGMYDDGTPGELFITMSKEGSTISGLMDSFATAVSLGLQHGVPLQSFISKFKHTRFEPSGWTGNGHHASSVLDYLFQWLEGKFGDGAVPVAVPVPMPVAVVSSPSPKQAFVVESDAPNCHECGALMFRSGACHKCANCGATSGCS